MNITKTVKRFFLFIFFLLLLVVGIAVAIPYFFKDEIVARVKQDLNENLNATVAFEDVSLSLLRSFPSFSFSLDELTITGKEEFEGINFTSAKNLRFTLDLMSVIKQDQDIEIKEIQMIEPDINIVVLKNGKSNYDIFQAVETAEASEEEDGEYNFLILLKEYGIQSGNFTYDDRSADIHVKLMDINHNGAGDFTQDDFDLITKTIIEEMTIKMGSVNYLYKTKGNFEITLNANLKEYIFTLKENDLLLNDLRLKADGVVKTKDFLSYDMDLDFNAPKNNFKNFLSLIPHAYTKDYAAVKADGTLQLKGNVKGVYDGEKETYPAFKILLDVDNASFKYPDLPMGVNDIVAKAVINSPSSDFDKIAVDIPNLNMKIGEHPFHAEFKLRTPISDPDIDTKIKGKIDLAELAKAFPMEGVSSINGLIDADLVAKAKMSDMDRGSYEDVNMSGILNIANLNYKADELPLVKINSMNLDFTPKRVNVPAFNMKLGKSDLKGQGNIDNILAYFSPEKTMRGAFDVSSEYFDANEWLTEESATSDEAVVIEDNTSEVFDRFDFDVKGKAQRIIYDVYQIDRTTFAGNVTPSKASIDQFSLMLGKSDLSGSGSLTNLFNYVFKDETLGGQLTINSKFFDLNPFMEESPEGANPNAKTIANEELEPFLVPEKMDIDIDATIGKVLYTDLSINNLKGSVKVKDEAIRFENCKGKTLGGNMVLSGGYNTTDHSKPAFDLDYKIQKFDFQKSFKQFNTFAVLAPIAEYIEGRFNSSMSFSGTLGKDLMPILDNVNADGFLQTINSVVRGLEPLENIGNTLNIDLFKKLEIKDTKNWFEIKNGQVEVKEFKLSQQGIDMLIGGTHGFNQEMNYNIKAKIPRSLMEKGAVGTVANKGINFLKKEAGKIGVNIDVGAFIDVLINVTGSINQPKVKFKVLGAGGEKTLVETVKEEVKQVVEEKKEEVKQEVTKVVDEKKEDVKKKMDAEIKAIMTAAEKQADGIRQAGRKTAEEARKVGYQQADNLVKKAGSNPIKKKAAQIAANKLKKETDKKVTDIKNKADQKAEQVMATARKKVAEVQQKYQNK